jgi:hypothetical protein
MERLPTVDRLIRRATRLAVVAGVVSFWYVVAASPDVPTEFALAGWGSTVAVLAALTLLVGGGWPRHRP